MTLQQLVDTFFAAALFVALVSIAAGVWHWVVTWWRRDDEAQRRLDAWDNSDDWWR